MTDQKTQKNKRLKEITDQLEEGVQELFSSQKYAEYLKVISKFHHYSANNALMIFMQRPDASCVAGYEAWKKKFKRQVKKGEHGIIILAPSPYKVLEEQTQTSPDGISVTVTEEVTRAAFKPVVVFDISQTEGEPLPSLGVDELTGNVENYRDFFEALKQVSPFLVSFEKITYAKGYCDYKNQRIAINEGMSEVQNVKTAIHEITHAILHNFYAETEKEIPPEQRKDQRTCEVEAESVAYTVCQHYGIDTSDYSFGYIAGWSSGKETKELKTSLDMIQSTAAGLIDSIDEKFQKIVKEHAEIKPPEQAGPDTFTIYQLKEGEDLRYHRFASLKQLLIDGLTVQHQNYDRIYTAPLEKDETLDNLYQRFNTGHPKDFTGRSLSVSDVVVLHQDGKDHAYYVDNFGFSEVPQFIEQQRADAPALQEDSMLDGILTNFPPDAAMTGRANALIDFVEQDGQRFGNGERRLIVEYAERVQDDTKLIALVNELAEQGFEQKNHYVDPAVVERVDNEIAAAKVQRMIGGPLDPTIQPIVTIIWSESDKLRDGQQMTLAEADALFQQLDAAHGPGYDKTKFRIDFTFQGELDSYEGRQDFGDGDGGLIDHIKAYHEYYAKDEHWKNYVLNHDGLEALEQDEAQRKLLLTELIPYLRLHCNLSAMEHAATGMLAAVANIEEPDGIDRTNTAYDTALQSYVNECRKMLNNGVYELPEAPKKENFIDPELQAYQEQVREEVSREALAAGMTVEEYAANDYEPRSSSQQVQEQAKAPAVETSAPAENLSEAPVEDGKTTAPTYYAIDETAARHAKEAISFSDYRPGSATSEYRQMVDEAAQIAEQQKKRVEPMYHEKIDWLLDTYCRKLAANMNHRNEIMARVPSVMIAGPSNFPVRKKNKQNAALDSNMQEWRDIRGLLDKIRSTGMGGISADDPDAVKKLQAKLANLLESQETMKAVNAYYRKHKTLDGCPHLAPETIEKLKTEMTHKWHLEDKPFASWALSNNSAEIRRVKARIESLTRKEQTPFAGWEFDGGKVEINREENRLQVFFEGKPDADTRTELKGGGFRWAPSAGAWQRQLTDNAFRAADSIKAIAPLTGEKPTELQRKARKALSCEQRKDTRNER